MTVYLFVLSAAFASAPSASPATKDGMAWETDLTAAQRQARESNRLILLHFGGPWCEPCRRLEEQVFSQPGFGRELASRYVAVKVDPHLHPELAEQYGVRAVPTDVVTTARGQLVMRMRSPPTLAAYHESMLRIADSAQPAASAVAESNRVTPQVVHPAAESRPAGYTGSQGPGRSPPPPGASASTTAPAPGGIARAAATSAVIDNAAAVESAPAKTAAPSRNPPFALDRYCTVTLVEKRRWQLGNERYGAIHRGRTYLFVDEAAQKKFLANPDHYSLAWSGSDPVLYVERHQEVPGKREHGAFYGNRIYLFSGEDTFQQFGRDPARYTAEGLITTHRR